MNLCLYLYISMCIYACMYLYPSVHVCTYRCINVCMCASIYLRILHIVTSIPIENARTISSMSLWELSTHKFFVLALS